MFLKKELLQNFRVKACKMGKFFYDRKGYPRWKNSKQLVHRTVAKNKVGGNIWKGNVVHHKDGNKKNFRRSNLTVMKRSTHSRYHAKRRRGFW